jgi:hypothetical protein
MLVQLKKANYNFLTLFNNTSNFKKMNQIRKNYLKNYGYTPTDSELLCLYTNGCLLLTDNEENELIKYFNL